jgi:hypothetical protein
VTEFLRRLALVKNLDLDEEAGSEFRRDRIWAEGLLDALRCFVWARLESSAALHTNARDAPKL